MSKIMNFIKKNQWLILIFLIIIVSAAIIWLIIPTGKPERPDNIVQGDYSYAADYAEYQIQAAMKKHKIPGIIFAMIDGPDVIYSKTYGYADAKNKIETTADTIFKAGSISKVFTGIEVMRLQQAGLIDINSPFAEYVPEFSINNRFTESEPITVKDILSHRSGLPRGGTLFLWDWSCRPLVLDAQMKSLSESYMVYPPGYRYKYSNVGYNILAGMIEKVNDLEPPAQNTAGAFPYYMQENFFDPLGMNNTSFGSHPLMYGTQYANPVATGYYRTKGKNVPYNQFDIISMASGNVHTTLNDMITFTKSLLNADDESFITKEILDTMYYHAPDNSRDLKENGLTWFRNSSVLGETVVFHDGTNQGFISMLAMIPEHDLGIIIIANSDEFENVKSILSFDILRVMLEAKTGKTLLEKQEPSLVNLSEETLKSLTGKYLMNDEIIEVIYKNSKLKAKYKGFAISLKPIGENVFTFSNPLSDAVASKISFFPGNEFEEQHMILEMGDVFFCPRYPDVGDVPDPWLSLEGKYNRDFRHPSEYSSEGDTATVRIKAEDGILMLENSFAILPVSNDRLLIQGGVFHGETMEYDPDTGVIIWQHLVYQPTD